MTGSGNTQAWDPRGVGKGKLSKAQRGACPVNHSKVLYPGRASLLLDLKVTRLSSQNAAALFKLVMADWNALPAEVWHQILKISLDVTDSAAVNSGKVIRASELRKTCKVINSALTGKVSCDLWANIDCNQRSQTTDILVRVAGYVKHLHIQDTHRWKAGLELLSRCCCLESVHLYSFPCDVDDVAAAQHAWPKARSSLHLGPAGIGNIASFLVQIFGVPVVIMLLACVSPSIGLQRL